VGMAKMSAAAVEVLTVFWTTALAPLFALLGLLAFEHAYVQAGQAVPLA
jgi:hypothetical protein